MSKIEHDRPRHIAFQIDAPEPLSRAAVADAVRAAAKALGWPEPERPRLTRYRFPHGAVRVPHERQRGAVALLQGLRQATDKGRAIEFQVTTLGASGTLEALTGRLGILDGRES